MVASKAGGCARSSASSQHTAPRRASRWQCLLATLLAFACLASAGCTSLREYWQNGCKVGPNYCRPPAPVADEWIEAKDTNVQHRQVDDWWNVFQDPTLNSLIDTAYNQNLTLRVLGTRVLQARAQQAIAVGSIFPQMQQAEGQYSRVGLSHNTFNNPSAFSGLTV